ncbi:MAG: helix-turn-helix transcriptional regulator [Raoultibacter sp.]
MSIGERIKQLREEHNWSQEHLAGLLGYKSRSTVNKIELGINEITLPKILAFAKALGVSEYYLLGLNDEPANAPATAKQLEAWDEQHNKNGGLAEEVALYERNERQYGKEVHDLLDRFQKLNKDGKEKVVEYTTDIAKLPEYQNGKEAND